LTTFKLAAVEILKKSKKPINYKDITKIALERKLIKTSGRTPIETMNSEINKDIRNNKGKSFFKKTDRGFFIINRNYRK